ncbi:MAG: phosphoribosyl-AMP cyclohydrolase [Candidatus Thorarchaeota archaeon]
MKRFSETQISKILERLNFYKIEHNLIPIIAQDYKSNEILMLGFANKEAISKSLSTGYLHYYSRSKKRLWKKGEESGHVQEIQKIFIDCDFDTILFKVQQQGAACHKGYFSCFYNEFIDGNFKIIGKKLFQPEDVYKNQKKESSI